MLFYENAHFDASEFLHLRSPYSFFHSQISLSNAIFGAHITPEKKNIFLFFCFYWFFQKLRYNKYMNLHEDKNINLGFQKAEALTRQFAKTFYFTSFFLPKKKRLASYCIYAICRISDESVDGAHEEKETLLSAIEQNIKKAYSLDALEDPVLTAFRETIRTYEIPQLYFDELIDGMRMDLTKTRYPNFHELYCYCYKVAGVIGLMMLKIFGCRSVIARQYAIDLGIALQLTNILRDIKEDLDRGRIYLPQDELASQGVTEESIKTCRIDDSFKRMMQLQIHRARFYYAQARCGIELITDSRCRFVAFLIAKLYAMILNEIEKNHFDVYRKKIRVARLKRIWVFPKLLLQFAKPSLILSE